MRLKSTYAALMSGLGVIALLYLAVVLIMTAFGDTLVLTIVQIIMALLCLLFSWGVYRQQPRIRRWAGGFLIFMAAALLLASRRYAAYHTASLHRELLFCIIEAIVGVVGICLFIGWRKDCGTGKNSGP